MGCVCGKPSSAVKDSEETPRRRELDRKTSQLRVARAGSARRDESFLLKEKLDNGIIKMGSIDKKGNGASRRVRDDYYEKRVQSFVETCNFPTLGNIPRAAEGEQIAAGWPSWLVGVAGEAIKGWIPRKADTFEKLEKIGQGTYSSVYKGRDLIQNKFVALKKVRFDNMDAESVKFMAREILILRRLDHPNIIKLEGLITSRTSSTLYLVFEYMEHDLTGLASIPGVKFTESQIKCYMQQLLSGLEYCHSHNVLHRDIKGSNLLIDDHGILKIADFGLASYFDSQKKIPLTSRVVTLWYRPPELLLGSTHYETAVDLWSAGCILGELYTGRPIMTGTNEVEQLHNIFKLCGSPSGDYWKKSKLTHSPGFRPYRRRIAETFKDLPAVSVALLETLLSIDPSDRDTATGALNSEFFKTPPLACDPSSLPKYPPTKEMDAKLREEEARRQGAHGVKGRKGVSDYRRSKELRTARPPDATAELAKSTKPYILHGSVNQQGQNQVCNSQEESVGRPPINSSSYGQVPDETCKIGAQESGLYSGPLAQGSGLTLSKGKDNGSSIVTTRNSASTYSGMMASRTMSSVESRDRLASSDVEALTRIGRGSDAFGDSVRKQDTRLEPPKYTGSHQAETGRINVKGTDKDGHVDRARKIHHFSGPLVAPSNKVEQVLREQVLREHERLIQEASRRIRQQGNGRTGPALH